MRPGLRISARWKARGRAWRRHAPKARRSKRSRRRTQPRTKQPLIVVANSPSKEAALGGLERWKMKHPEAAGMLAVDDVLVDSMRGRSSTWTRIRVNLRHVAEDLRPAQGTPDPDDDPTREWRESRAASREMTQRITQRPLAKISISSCGGTTSSCAYVQSFGLLSIRHLRKCDMCRKRASLHVFVGHLGDQFRTQTAPTIDPCPGSSGFVLPAFVPAAAVASECSAQFRQG